MIRSGDEVEQTQHGNNNPYCQDNEISWINWDLNAEQKQFLEFVKQMTALWHAQPVFKRRNFFQGRRIQGAGVKDVAWLTQDGEEIADHHYWHSSELHALGMRLNGNSIDEVDERGRPIVGETLLVLLNSQPGRVSFRLPRHKPSERWIPYMDTSLTSVPSEPLSHKDSYSLQGRCVVVLILRSGWPPQRKMIHASHPLPHSEAQTTSAE